ncbi:DUF6387 family protein [Vibrio ulleungensis]|uniref:Uncharacterized protein n=1 Tax=Vibrio ulleungensis TaxID=2807619 RepID=A0ABS2HME2_9VIBR|nr:DUF6387 family protein [Vibrio ulleungensis]MBM7038209.1 hypothetical protein [Vibrio ulleungensis]
MNKAQEDKKTLDQWIESKSYSQIWSSVHTNNEALTEWTVSQLLEQTKIRLDFIAHALLNSGNISNCIQWRQLNERNLIDLPPVILSTTVGTHCQLLKKTGIKELLEMEANVAHATMLDEYLVTLPDGEQGIFAYIPLSTYTSKQLHKDFVAFEKDVRNQVKIQEPIAVEKRTEKSGAIRSLISYRAIIYLDILIWLIHEHKLDSIDDIPSIITANEIASALNIHKLDTDDEDIGASNIRSWKRDFYSPKLTKSNWFERISIQIRQDQEMMSLKVSTLLQCS